MYKEPKKKKELGLKKRPSDKNYVIVSLFLEKQLYYLYQIIWDYTGMRVFPLFFYIHTHTLSFISICICCCVVAFVVHLLCANNNVNICVFFFLNKKQKL